MRFIHHVFGQLQHEVYSAGLLNGFALNRTFDSLTPYLGLVMKTNKTRPDPMDRPNQLLGRKR